MTRRVSQTNHRRASTFRRYSARYSVNKNRVHARRIYRREEHDNNTFRRGARRNSLRGLYMPFSTKHYENIPLFFTLATVTATVAATAAV